MLDLLANHIMNWCIRWIYIFYTCSLYFIFLMESCMNNIFVLLSGGLMSEGQIGSYNTYFIMPSIISISLYKRNGSIASLKLASKETRKLDNVFLFGVWLWIIILRNQRWPPIFNMSLLLFSCKHPPTFLVYTWRHSCALILCSCI